MSKISSLRFVIKAVLATAFLGAFVIIVVALIYLISGSVSNVEGAWATVTAALAVIASVVIAWTGQRVLELQQDAQQPYPYPTIDSMSRYGVLQLSVRNLGGTPAYDVFICWDEPLLDSQGRAVAFTKQEKAPQIPVLLAGESVSVLIDETSRFFGKIEDANYSGYVKFKDASRKCKKHKFCLSAEVYRNSLYYEKEELKTHYKIQEIPGKLEKLTSELHNLRTSYLEESQDNISQRAQRQSGQK